MSRAGEEDEVEEREWLVQPGEWEVEFVGYRVSNAYGGRFIVEAKLLAGPFISGEPLWRRDQSALADVPSGYDDPALAVIPRWYAAATRDGRVALKAKSDLARDWYRLTGQRPASLKRFPVTGFSGRRARVIVASVTKDHRKLECFGYSKIEAVLGPLESENLSAESWQIPDSTRS